MAKVTKKTNKNSIAKARDNKRSISSGRKQNVLRITDFELIFEPSDAKRKQQKGPLSFTKSLVTIHFLSKEAEIRYFEKMKVLKSHLERHLLRSVFEDLKNWTAAKYLGPRGYLVTTEGRPADCEYLSKQLDISVEDLEKAMPILEHIGLIEQTVFDGSLDTNRTSRTQPDAAGRKRKPLNKYNDNNNGKGKNNNKYKSATTKANSITNKIDNNKEKERIDFDNRQKESMQGQDEKQSNQNPPTTQPIEPTESDTGGQVIQFTNPLRSVNHTEHRRNEPQQIGDIAKGMMYQFSPDAKAFAGDVFQALQLTCKPDSVQGRRELASFASIFMDASYSGLSSPALDALRERAIAEARRIRKNWKSRQGKPAAVFVDVFKKLVFSAKTKPAM